MASERSVIFTTPVRTAIGTFGGSLKDVPAPAHFNVDDQLRTSVPGVWALGDCNGKGAFTHTSYNDFEIVAANLLDGDRRRVSDRLPAYALYIDAPLGRAGMTEAEARHGILESASLSELGQ